MEWNRRSAWATMVLRESADELYHIGILLRMTSGRRRKDRLLVAALLRRRDRLIRLMQLVCHGVIYVEDDRSVILQ